ncbi:MAG: acyltransferase [Chloroflexi bacterium]|nr:acyltransferase [Chloroflexota bacterium]
MPNSLLNRVGGAARRLLFGEPAVSKTIRGTGNLFQAEGARLSNVELDIVGDRNRITIGDGCIFYNLKFHIRGSDNVIEIGENCRFTRSGLIWLEDDGCTLSIGQGTTMVDATLAVTEPGSRIAIGEECMFANDIDVRCGDSHAILDAASGKRINYAEDVTIGRHVWIAAHTVILKGVTIGENSVIASGAIVTRSCDPGSILAGNPAKVIRSGISWQRERILKSE